MCICWLFDSLTSIAGGDYLARGPWANHCFDIVSEKILAEEMAIWRDVTSEALKEIESF